jgi:hypothetical protein
MRNNGRKERVVKRKAGKGHLTAFFRRFGGFRAVQRHRGLVEEGEPRKNNSKIGHLLAIFGLNLEKEGVFGEGF